MSNDPAFPPGPEISGAPRRGERRIMTTVWGGVVLALLLLCGEMNRRHRREMAELREDLAKMLQAQRAAAARETELMKQESVARRMKAALDDAWDEMEKLRKTAAQKEEDARLEIAELTEKLAAAEQSMALSEAAEALSSPAPAPAPSARPAAANRRGR